MGQLVLKAAVLVALNIVCVISQLELQGNGLSEEHDLKNKPPEERYNYQPHVIINPPDCSSQPRSSCNCTKIQALMSAELQETNHQLHQLQTAVYDQQGFISSGLNDTNSQLKQLQKTASHIVELLSKEPVLIAEDCTELLARSDGAMKSGVYTVQPPGDGAPLQVYCDMETDDSGWTVFQRRQNGSVDFYRNFYEYREGFGNLEGEFWLGNDNLNRFTAQGAYQLRVDMRDFQGNSAYAVYDTFRVGALDDNYRLQVADYSGTAGNSMSYSNNRQFSTWDSDHDSSVLNCAEEWHGAWWFAYCFYAHLNGEYIVGGKTDVKGIIWEAWKGYHESLKSSEMKIRKKY